MTHYFLALDTGGLLNHDVTMVQGSGVIHRQWTMASFISPTLNYVEWMSIGVIWGFNVLTVSPGSNPAGISASLYFY